MTYQGEVKDGVVVLADGARLAEGTIVQVVPVCTTRDEAGSRDARQRFERHFGAVDLGYSTGADNPAIDADLARAYADEHKDA
ncbi:MAG: hypothetical protein O3C40_29560 [Planctomycetota bacterium]|nr:hypothetical protein [Planctomycetota bacterium]